MDGPVCQPSLLIMVILVNFVKLKKIAPKCSTLPLTENVSIEPCIIYRF